MSSGFFTLFLKTTGVVIFLVALALFITFFGAWIKEELRFSFENLTGVKYTADFDIEFKDTGYRVLYPQDQNLSIIIPKIGVSKSISRTNLSGADQITQEGGIAFVGDGFLGKGTIFLVAHPPKALLERIRVNPEFYLIRYLEAGDEIVLVSGGKKSSYKVEIKDIANTFPQNPPDEDDALFLVAADPILSSWVTVLAKRQ